MIDLHCHILPGVDDGPATLRESLYMARYAVEDGIHTIAATPHSLGGTFPNPPQKILKDVETFRECLISEKIPLTIYPGAEVHFCPDMAKHILSGKTTFLDQAGRYILIEFPFQIVPKKFKENLFQLRQNNIIPIIAHPERNPVIYRDTQFLADLISMGCLTQINSTSVTGGFGDEIFHCTKELLELRMVHIIASDAHSAASRPPSLSLAVQSAADILKSQKEALEMVTERPKSILNGKPVKIPEFTIPPKKKRFFFF